VLNAFQNLTIVAAILAGSIAFLWGLQRVWPNERRRPHNDLIGWQVTVLGTTYAVIVGFMLYTVWTDFQLADGNAEAEANCLVNLARSAEGFSNTQRLEVQNLARGYVDTMLADEWPAMNSLRFSPESHRIIQQLWATMTQVQAHNASEQTNLDHALTELSDMTMHRRLRELQALSSLPGILWAVLIVGAVMTIVSACLFGSAEFKLHLVQVAMLAAILSLALVAIADINRPFQGAVHVSPTGFIHAREAINDLKTAH
jgi:hypothetical protein